MGKGPKYNDDSDAVIGNCYDAADGHVESFQSSAMEFNTGSLPILAWL